MTLSENAKASLLERLGPARVATDPVALMTYEYDATLERGSPEAVVFPQSIKQLQELVNWANEHAVPLVARGAGTGLSGGAVAELGGVVVEFSRMNRLVEFDVRGRWAVVEPGVPNLTFNEWVTAKGLYYPPDPASQRASTLGGNVAENAGGPHCFKYGVTTNYVTGLEIVLADGRAVHLGGRALDYPEYDLLGLVVGSEGTLALITAVAVRLIRNPPGIKTMMAIFDSVAQCGAAVSAVIATGVVPATLEMMDRQFLRAAEQFVHAGLPTDAGAVLIAEVDGYPEGLDSQIQAVAEILRSCGGRGIKIARTSHEREQIWRARRSAGGVFALLAPSYYLIDITVPRSRLASILEGCDDICSRFKLAVQYVLHAGDGNLHPVILIPEPDDPDLIQMVHSAAKEMTELAVRENGSLTGEHGVGIEKREYLSLMFDPAELRAMWDVKQVFDPDQRLNPGKIFHKAPSENPCEGSETFARFESVVIPASAEEAARTFTDLANAGRRVRIGGGIATDMRLSTAALTGIKTFAPDDLYVTVGAGTKVADLDEFLAQAQYQTPLASPWAEATVGGIVAANVNAPLRLRYGSVRDSVLAMTVALPDGRVIRAGRPVVKNVAGYDLPKVFVGSYGSLGLITDVTLKITPLSRIRQTLQWRMDDWRQALDGAEQLLSIALVSSGIILCQTSDGCLLAYTVEGLEQDVEVELNKARQLIPSGSNSDGSESCTALWRRWLGEPPDELVVRIGLAPGHLTEYLEAQRPQLEANGFFVDWPHGLVYARRIVEDASAADAWLNALRQDAIAAGGYAVVMSAPDPYRVKSVRRSAAHESCAHLDRLGYRPETLELMRGLKARWDPAGILESEFFVL